MKIASIIKKHMIVNEPFVIKYNADEVGDTSIPETYIEVTGLPEEEADITAVGYTLADSDGVSMKFADIAGLDTAESITHDGLYLILSGALEKLELNTNVECDVIVKQVI